MRIKKTFYQGKSGNFSGNFVGCIFTDKIAIASENFKILCVRFLANPIFSFTVMAKEIQMQRYNVHQPEFLALSFFDTVAALQKIPADRFVAIINDLTSATLIDRWEGLRAGEPSFAAGDAVFSSDNPDEMIFWRRCRGAQKMIFTRSNYLPNRGYFVSSNQLEFDFGPKS